MTAHNDITKDKIKDKVFKTGWPWDLGMGCKPVDPRYLPKMYKG